MAKKYNSAYEGTPIQIKRTDLSINKDSEKTRIDDDGTLKYGEPLFLNKEKYLLLGDGNTKTSEIQDVFQSVPKERAEWISFFDNLTAIEVGSKGPKFDKTEKLVELTDSEGNPIFSRLKFFTISEGRQGRTVDYQGNEVKITVGTGSKWYKVQPDGQITTEQTDWNSNIFPKAQMITISGMKESVIPFIGLSLTDAQKGSSDMTKRAKKLFGNITDVESKDGYIIVYCGYKNLKTDTDLYLNVFGG